MYTRSHGHGNRSVVRVQAEIVQRRRLHCSSWHNAQASSPSQCYMCHIASAANDAAFYTSTTVGPTVAYRSRPFPPLVSQVIGTSPISSNVRIFGVIGLAIPGDINVRGERGRLLPRDLGVGATCGGITGDADRGGIGAAAEDDGRGSGAGGGGRSAGTGDLTPGVRTGWNGRTCDDPFAPALADPDALRSVEGTAGCVFDGTGGLSACVDFRR